MTLPTLSVPALFLSASLLLIGTILSGCGSATPVAPANAATDAKPWQDLKSKMDAMTPEQRAQYIKDHPDELANLGRIETPATPPTNP